jgi:hypothetical protein
MRKIYLAILVGASLMVPAAASADVVAGVAVLPQGPTPYTNVNINAGVDLGFGFPLGVNVLTDTSLQFALVGVVQCLRVEGKRASVVTRFLDPLTNGQGDFVGQVFWFEDRGLLGLLGQRDRVRNFRLTESELSGQYSTCPSVTSPLPYNEIRAGDITVIDT